MFNFLKLAYSRLFTPLSQPEGIDGLTVYAQVLQKELLLARSRVAGLESNVDALAEQVRLLDSELRYESIPREEYNEIENAVVTFLSEIGFSTDEFDTDGFSLTAMLEELSRLIKAHKIYATVTYACGDGGRRSAEALELLRQSGSLIDFPQLGRVEE